MAKTTEAVDFFDWIQEISAGNKHFSLQKGKFKKELFIFLKENAFFGVPVLEHARLDEPLSVSRPDLQKLEPGLALWIRSYGAGNNEKLILLTDRLRSLVPKTGNLFADYIERNCSDNRAAWILADYLCFTLKAELIEMKETDLDALAAEMDKELPLNAARLFSSFLIYVRENRHLSNGWTFHFKSRRETQPQEAYSALDFMRMAYIVFNDEAWEKEHLLKKALQSKNAADLWLFVSLHFICGWRRTDLLRLPVPKLPVSGDKLREAIAMGDFNTENILNELEWRLRYTPRKPHKTEAYEGVSELKLFVPESLRKPMGIILAIAASHHEDIEPGDCFLKVAGQRKQLQLFFGKDFVAACGNRDFSTRRANKAYLQGLEAVADNSSAKPKGYMLAALARSHKGHFGSLPTTTDIYLRDANFSGYRPEFIAKEMFERGVFSFIPALMLEMYAQQDYRKLSPSAQTELIAEIGIAAYGLENMTKTVEASLVKARSAIAEIMRRPESIRGTVADILQNIAVGNAPGKQEGCLCLMTAAGYACADAERNCCIGCGYEIYTRTILYQLTKEYARLLESKKTADKAEAERCTKILKEAVMPAIAEIITSIKKLYPESDLSAMLKVTGLAVNI